MAEKLGLANEIKEIKIGKSFMKGEQQSFHTFRYDFMPASVDSTKRASIDIGEGNQVTVTVPHIEGSGIANTIFKGSKKPYQKECVLIIDHNTGEITLEKLTYNVQLKKTRAEGSSKLRANTPVDLNFNNKKSPNTLKPSPQPKQYPASLGRSSPIQKCSPLPKSPFSNQVSPNSNSMPSLTMLAPKPLIQPSAENGNEEPDIGVLSSSSSSDSSSENSSESSSSDNEETAEPTSQPSMPSDSNWKDMPSSHSSTHFAPTANSFHSMPKFSQLSEDLKLSESDSESDT